jgi:hypothetical protein
MSKRHHVLQTLIWLLCLYHCFGASFSARGNALGDSPILYAPDEIVSNTSLHDEYCGAVAGKKHYEGHYFLKLGKFSVPLTPDTVISFDEGTDHDKKIYGYSISGRSGDHLFAFIQHGSCAYKILTFMKFVNSTGFSNDPIQFCEPKQFGPYECNDSVVQSPHLHWNVIPQLDLRMRFVTRSISQETNFFVYKRWQYDSTQNAFIKIAEWTKAK